LIQISLWDLSTLVRQEIKQNIYVFFISRYQFLTNFIQIFAYTGTFQQLGYNHE